MLETLRAIDASYRDSAEDTKRLGNTDLLMLSNNNPTTSQQLPPPQQLPTIRFCNIIEMNRHSLLLLLSESDRSTPPSYQRVNLPHVFPRQVVAAVALAMDHLNSGNGIIVPAITGLNDTCNIRFVPEFLDTAGIAKQAVSSLIRVLDRTTFSPCAFVGAFLSEESIPTAIITGVNGYPQITALSTNPQLADKNRFPLFGSVISTANEYGLPLLDYLYRKWHVRHLGILHSNTDVSLAYLDGLQQSATTFPELRLESVGFNDHLVAEEIQSKIQLLKDTELRFFVLISTGESLELILREAFQQGIAGTKVHHWIATDEGLSLIGNREYMGNDDPILKAATGLFIYKPTFSRPQVGRYDAFLTAWTAIRNNTNDIAYLQDKLPMYPKNETTDESTIDTTGYTATIDSSVFGELHPYVPLFYDAIILLGLSACSVPEDQLLEGNVFFQQILQTSFVGASGPLELNPKTASRTTAKSLFVLYNSIPQQQRNGNFTLSNIELGLYQNGAWIDLAVPLFNDQTSHIPKDLPPLTIEKNYIGRKLRYFGFILFGVVVLTSLTMAGWTLWNQKSRVIRAAQPFFLYFICIGATLMAASILPMSLDDELLDDPSRACFGFPVLLTFGWCFSVSALLSKTIVINSIFRQPAFQRVVLTWSDILKPMIFQVIVNVVVLILWATISPYRWERHEVHTDRFGRPIETTGRCESDHDIIFWTVVLLFNVGVLSFASQQAFVARKIAIEFAESEYISFMISITLVASFVACPVMFMVKDEPRAFFFVRSAFVFSVSMTLLLFLFLPKIIYYHQYGNQNYETAVKTTLERLQNQNPHSRRPCCEPDDDQIGARVVDHPKLRQEKEQELMKLTKRNQMLELRLAEYEPMSAVMSDDISMFLPSSNINNLDHRKGCRDTEDSFVDAIAAKSADIRE